MGNYCHLINTITDLAVMVISNSIYHTSMYFIYNILSEKVTTASWKNSIKNNCLKMVEGQSDNNVTFIHLDFIHIHAI